MDEEVHDDYRDYMSVKQRDDGTWVAKCSECAWVTPGRGYPTRDGAESDSVAHAVNNHDD